MFSFIELQWLLVYWNCVFSAAPIWHKAAVCCTSTGRRRRSRLDFIQMNSRYAFVIQDTSRKYQACYEHSVSSRKYDQHNNSDSFRDLYYEINQVKESFKHKGLFPLHQWSARPRQRVPGRSTIPNISQWRLEQVSDLSDLRSASSFPYLVFPYGLQWKIIKQRSLLSEEFTFLPG